MDVQSTAGTCPWTIFVNIELLLWDHRTGVAGVILDLNGKYG